MGILLLSSDVDAATTVDTATGPLVRWLPDVVTQTQQWRTDILKAHDGTEHRVAVLPTPRDRFELGWVLDDDMMREIRDELLLSPDQTFLVPLAHESEALTAALTGTTLYFDQTYCDWCQVGRSVLVLGYDDTGTAYHQATITAVDPTGNVTISPTASPLSFAAGAARVYPLAALYLGDGAPTARYPVNAGQWSLTGVTADLMPELGTGGTVTEFDIYPVLDLPPLNTEQVVEAVEAGVQVIDYGGVIEAAWGRSVADMVRGVRLMLATRAERQWAKAFLDACRGRQCAFWLPTWRRDLVTLSYPDAGDDTVTVESTDILDAGSSAHVACQFAWANGDISYHTVVTATDNLDGTHGVEFSPVFPYEIDGEHAVVISWLELCRLATDEVTWSHGSTRSILNLSAQVVQW